MKKNKDKQSGKQNGGVIRRIPKILARVHHTDKGSTYNDWVSVDRIRPFNFQHFQKGSKVKADGSSIDNWPSAIVMESWESLHFFRFEGYSPAYDEWVGPSRIRANDKIVAGGLSSNLSGKWTGYWENNLNEKGKDSLVISEDADGNIKGTWSGDVKVTGKRINASTTHLWGQTANRSYQFTATVQQGVITLKYVAKRLDEGGSYEGKSTLSPVK